MTRVKQQNPDLPENEIYFGGPIVAAGEGLQMGAGDTIKVELYEDSEPVAVLDQANGSIGNVTSIPTAVSFVINGNGSSRPDGDWWGQDVLLTVTIGSVAATAGSSSTTTELILERVPSLRAGVPPALPSGTCAIRAFGWTAIRAIWPCSLVYWIRIGEHAQSRDCGIIGFVKVTMQSKIAIRRQMSALRKALPTLERERASRAICAKLIGDREIAAATSQPDVNALAVYLSSPNEIDLSDFICEMLTRHADVVAPRWNGKDYDLAKLHGLDENNLRRGPMNILEPASAEIVEPSQVAVWIIPGLAFTKDGARLGYGGGWYDRLLAESNAASLKIGVAYSFQILPDLPREPHDIPLTRIVTSP